MIQLPVEPKVIDESKNKTTFEISPLYPGYGATVGNVIRRVLVSSLEGAAVTAAKIKGVDHEFTSIPGVMEDVLEIIFNLKKVRFKLHKDEPTLLNLKVKGQKEVTAGDIETTSDVEVVNKEQLIATLTDKKAELEIEIRIERGVGYVPVEQRQKEKLSVGEIAIDGIFTPIRNVNFTVENIRVGQRTDYNKVILDIETDGTITPQQALKDASRILINHFEIINGNGQAMDMSPASEEMPTEDSEEADKKKTKAKKQ